MSLQCRKCGRRSVEVEPVPAADGDRFRCMDRSTCKQVSRLFKRIKVQRAKTMKEAEERAKELAKRIAATEKELKKLGL